MRQFPLVLVPPDLQRIAQSKPVAPKFATSLPSVPAQVPQPIQVQEAILQTLGLIAIVALISLVARELGLILLIMGIVAIIVRIRFQFQSYNTRYQRYQAQFQSYLERLESYSREELKYQQELAIAHAPTRIQEFRHRQYQQFFNKYPPLPNLVPFQAENSQTAIAISQFANTLRSYLNQESTGESAGEIYQGIKVKIPNIEYEWQPQLIYIEPSLQARIAIEIIDTSNSSQSLMQSDLVERFLLDAGWIIIKFTQVQIAQHPTACVKEFAKLLDRLSIDPSLLNKVENVPDLTPIKPNPR